MEFEHSLSNGIRSLFRFVCNYQLISQFLIAFVGILIAYASEAKDGLLLNSFPPEFTISDIIHPVLGFFYAGVKIPNDRDTGSSWLLIHLIFVACLHFAKRLARIDVSVEHPFLFPVTEFIDENASLVSWILFASTVYVISTIISPIDQNRLNRQKAIDEMRLTYQTTINELTNQLSAEKSRSATTSNDRDLWFSKFTAEQALSASLSNNLKQEKALSSKLTTEAHLDKAELSKFGQLLDVSESSLAGERAYIDKANRRIGSMIKLADERDRNFAAALARTRIDIRREYRDEIKRLSTLRLVIKLKEVEAGLAEGKKELAKVRADLWRKEGKLVVLGEFEGFLKEFAEEVDALVQCSSFKDFMEGRKKYWAEEWDMYWNIPSDGDEGSEESREEESDDMDAECESDEE